MKYQTMIDSDAHIDYIMYNNLIVKYNYLVLKSNKNNLQKNPAIDQINLPQIDKESLNKCFHNKNILN